MESTSHEAETGQPHEALFFVLSFLPLFELLSMSEVSVSLRNAIKHDILLWLNICVQKPLNFKLSDEILMELVSKSNGRLRSLTLINCPRITDDGLLRIVNNNPFINKLSLLGCTGLTVNGVINSVKLLSELKQLQINGIYNVQKQDLEILQTYLQSHGEEDDDRIIDVEICPKCEEVKMVYDCPREKSTNHCRGCKDCIQRCEECGKCVDSEEQEDAVSVCMDALCLNCWIQFPKCSFCNKPYCNQHAHLQKPLDSSSGWVCEDCHDKFIICSNQYEE